ncbi:MAG: hypothetical protein RBU29_08630 [bacterium]|jgi:hypothetical protein|nr:hypothetical protein [bacterium]
MEYLGYGILGFAAFLWFMAMIFGLIIAFPWGILGLIAILGLGILFIKVLAERLTNREDDFYDKTVEK